MRRNLLYTAGMLVLAVVLVAGCSKSPEALLAPSTVHLSGVWEHQDTPIQLKLNENHTGEKIDGQLIQTFDWSAVGKQLTFTYTGSSKRPDVVKYSVGAADLILIWPDNRTERYVRQ